MPQLGLDLGDCVPNHAKDGPDVQDKGNKKYNRIVPFMIGYGIQRNLRLDSRIF